MVTSRYQEYYWLISLLITTDFHFSCDVNDNPAWWRLADAGERGLGTLHVHARRQGPGETGEVPSVEAGNELPVRTRTASSLLRLSLRWGCGRCGGAAAMAATGFFSWDGPFWATQRRAVPPAASPRSSSRVIYWKRKQRGGRMGHVGYSFSLCLLASARRSVWFLYNIGPALPCRQSTILCLSPRFRGSSSSCGRPSWPPSSWGGLAVWGRSCTIQSTANGLTLLSLQDEIFPRWWVLARAPFCEERRFRGLRVDLGELVNGRSVAASLSDSRVPSWRGELRAGERGGRRRLVAYPGLRLRAEGERRRARI